MSMHRIGLFCAALFVALGPAMDNLNAADPNGPLGPLALQHLASILQDMAHFDEAEQLYQKSIHLWELRPDAPSLELADALNGLSSLYNATGRLESAEALCRRSLAIRLKRLGPNNVDVAIAYSNLGVVLLRRKKFQDAAAVAQQALGIWNQLHSAQDRSAVDLNTLALVQLEERKFDLGLAYDQCGNSKVQRFPATGSLELGQLPSYARRHSMECRPRFRISCGVPASARSLAVGSVSECPGEEELTRRLRDCTSRDGTEKEGENNRAPGKSRKRKPPEN